MGRLSQHDTIPKDAGAKRILILSNSSFGLYRFRKEVIQSLATADEIYLSVPEDECRESLEALGAKVTMTPFNRRGMNPMKDLGLLLRYKKLLKEIRPDVVLTYTIKPNIYGSLACRLRKIPYIVNVTGLGTAIEDKGLLSAILIQLYRYGIKRARHCFFQNAGNKEVLLKSCKGMDNCSVLPGSGVNLLENAFEEYPPENRNINFLFVGRIMRDKGIDEYLECAGRIKAQYPKVSFDIVGGYEDDSYKDEIEAAEREGIVNYLGISHDVHTLMKEHFAVVHPSYHEGLSNVLLEAQACGRPVIATNVSGCGETYDDGITGIAFKPRDVEDMVAAVEKFIEMPYGKKKEMGISGRKKMEREFDRQMVIDAYEKEIDNA